MARIKIIRGTNLSDTATKEDCHDLVDGATAQIYDIVNSEVDASAAIVDTKLDTITTIGKVNLSALTISGQTEGDILYQNNAGNFIRLPIGTTGQKLRARNLQVDYFEYSTNLLAQTAYVTSSPSNVSNADIDDENMADITDWTDGDTGTGVSTQVSFDNKSCMKLDSGVTSTSSRSQDIGTFVTKTVFSLSTYFDALGTMADYGYLNFITSNNIIILDAKFATDGLFVYNGAAYVEVGTNVASIDTWQEWTFDVDWTAKTVDIYLDQVLVAADVSCDYASTAYADGYTELAARATSGTNTIVYVDWFKAGSNSAAGDLTAYSSTIKSQGTYSLKAIASTGALNDTLTRTVDPAIDLAGIDTLKFDIYAGRTGSNIKIGIHDSGGTTTEITPNVTSANAWQTVTWDISGVSDANKNVIDSIIVTIVNADVSNTFYLDNFYISSGLTPVYWVTP